MRTKSCPESDRIRYNQRDIYGKCRVKTKICDSHWIQTIYLHMYTSWVSMSRFMKHRSPFQIKWHMYWSSARTFKARDRTSRQSGLVFQGVAIYFIKNLGKIIIDHLDLDLKTGSGRTTSNIQHRKQENRKIVSFLWIYISPLNYIRATAKSR